MHKGKLFTTITTDAGIKDNVAAYCFYIRTDGKTYSRSDRFKYKKKDFTHAELCAILNAMHAVVNDSWFNKCDILVINTDSTGALSVLKK